jgi:hypothetical protein
VGHSYSAPEVPFHSGVDIIEQKINNYPNSINKKITQFDGIHPNSGTFMSAKLARNPAEAQLSLKASFSLPLGK